MAPLTVAIGTVGIAFGYLARQAGLSATAAITMSATTFAGSAQFAAISVLGGGGSLLAVATAVAALAMRNTAMSATAAPSLSGRWWQRLLLSQCVVDETWAIAFVPGRGFDREILIGAGLMLYVVHVSATALGALFGDFLGSPQRWGVDAMSPALFTLLLTPRLGDHEARVTAVVVAAGVIAAVSFVPPGVPILLGVVLAAIIGVTASRSRQPVAE